MAMNEGIEVLHGTDRRSLVVTNLFWLGFIFYTVSYTISQSETVSYILCNIFQVLGLMLMIPSAFSLFQLKIEDNFLRIVFTVYIIWTISVILRGLEFNYDSTKQMLFNPLRGVFPLIVPLVLLLPKRISNFRKIFGTIFIFGIFFVIFSLLFIKDLFYPYNFVRSQNLIETFVQYLSLASAFLLLTYVYHSKSLNFFSLFVISLTFILAVIRARRGLIFMSFNMLFFSFLLYQYINKTRVINIVLSAFLVLAVSYAALRMYEDNRKDTFSLINERIGDDTRSEVEEYFFNDFQPIDWIVGRGYNGQYYCPGVSDGKGGISIYRGVIETGFLQVILNGGIISLFLMSLIMIPAIFKGIFYSRNILSKAAGFWILLFFLYSYPGVPTTFTMNYILVWISVGVCYSREIRKISDSEVYTILRSE